VRTGNAVAEILRLIEAFLQKNSELPTAGRDRHLSCADRGRWLSSPAHPTEPRYQYPARGYYPRPVQM